MIQDYKKYLGLTAAGVEKIGMKLIEDTDFLAKFERRDGWCLVLEGERFNRPLVDLEVRPPNEKEGYSLRILMDVYQKLEGSPEVPPSLANQISFFVQNVDGWLSDASQYKRAYKELNETP